MSDNEEQIYQRRYIIAAAEYQRALTEWLNWSNWVDDERATFLAIAKDEAEAAFEAVKQERQP
jgi:hypothetical protein